MHGNGQACYLLGEALRELVAYEEALLPLERSADLLPDDIHVWLALGWCYKRTGQLAKAIDALERAVTVDPSEGVLHYNLACYWSLARIVTLALRMLSRALEIDGNFRDMITDEPDFDSLRSDPEFIAIANLIVYAVSPVCFRAGWLGHRPRFLRARALPWHIDTMRSRVAAIDRVSRRYCTALAGDVATIAAMSSGWP